MPTQAQMYACFRLLQSLSDKFCTVEVFRYDRKQERVYILAKNTLGEELQILVFKNGQWRFITDETRL